MSRQELFKELNRLCEVLDYSYNINSGGCCLVAAIIAKQLEESNIPFTVIHYDKYACHYAIRVKDRIINRSGYHYDEITSDKMLSSEELYDIYLNKLEDGYWNSCYNRQKNLIVRTKISVLFKKYNGNKRK